MGADLEPFGRGASTVDYRAIAIFYPGQKPAHMLTQNYPKVRYYSLQWGHGILLGPFGHLEYTLDHKSGIP
jgi:hypothetical protein